MNKKGKEREKRQKTLGKKNEHTKEKRNKN